MSLDILLLIATIVVAVAAVFASLLQAVLERRASGPPWARRGPRKVDAQRLARAVPPPARAEDPVRPRAESSPPKPVEVASPMPVMAPSTPAAPAPSIPAAATTVLITPPPVLVMTAPIEVDATAPAAPSAPAAPPGRQPASVAAASASVVSASAPAAWLPGESEPPDVPIDSELAYRIGVTGAQRPSRPAVMIVAGTKPRAVSVPGTVATEAWPERSHRRRRAAFRIAAVAAALAWVMTAVVVLPDLTQQGGVLSETGRPQASGDPGVVALDTPTPTSSGTPEPSPSPSPRATPTPSPTAAPTSTPTPSLASTGTVQVAVATPRPTATPEPTTAPTPPGDPGLEPTLKPARTPIAAFVCTTTSLTLRCDASSSANARSYTWDFSEGNTESGARASHVYVRSGQYSVTLTVTNAWGANSSTQTITIP